MTIKDIARVSLAAGRTTHQEGELAISCRLLGEIVVDDQGMFSLFHEVLGHRGTGIGSDVLQRGRATCSGDDDGGVVHGALVLEDLDHASHRGVLLADRHVKALHPRVFLVKDRVDGDRGLACLAVTDNQFPLATADGSHCIDRLDTCLQWLADGLAGGNAWCHFLDVSPLVRVERPLAVNRVAERIQNAADHFLTNRNREKSSKRLDLVSFLDLQVIAEDNHANAVFLEVECQALDTTWKLNHLAGHHVFKPVDTGDAVPDFQDSSYFKDIQRAFVLFNLLLEYRCDLVGVKFHRTISSSRSAKVLLL